MIENKNVLVAEDTRINQKVFRRIISKAGYNVVIKENGQEALDIFLQEPFDLVITDIMMPIMDGVTLIKEIRALDSEKSKIHVIAVSADVSDENRQNCLDAGVNEFITKPIDAGEFTQLINMVLLDSSHDKTVNIFSPKIDMSIIEDIAGSDLEVVLEIAEAILEGLEEDTLKFKQGIKNFDFEMIIMNSHRIKGNLFQIGEEVISKMALNLEDSSKQKDMESILKISDEFVKRIALVNDLLRVYIKSKC
ncbi:MAG: hypothetical protein COB02_11710 [Candidatus Cloacimonadota bacterium]|nr:MAG: hypothetical protein COB02_11710 [Candidatus Cloacimonadota bacterium]